MSGRLVLLPLVGLLLAGNTGCQLFGAMAYYFGPERRADAQFELTKNRLAIMIESAPSEYDHPMFRRGLYEKVTEIFADEDVNSNVVPYLDVLELQQREPDFSTWSLQRIGRELGAEQLLHIEVTEFSLRETPTHPVLAPQAAVSVKVINCNAPAGMARAWPDSVEGFPLDVKRPPREATSMRVIDSTAEKLGLDLGQYVARLFYEHSLEDSVPKER